MPVTVFRIVLTVVLVAMVSGLGVTVVRDGRRLEALSGRIAEQKLEKKRIGDERAVYQKRIEEAQEELGTAQDSLQKAAQMGVAMKRSLQIGKGILVLDNRELRANNLIKIAEKEQAAVRDHRRRWSAGLGGGLILLLAGLIALKKMAP